MRIFLCWMLCSLVAVSAYAGDRSWYLKSGVRDWQETVNGAGFVHEQGLVQELGVRRSDPLGPVLSRQSFSLLWALPRYSGEKLETGEPYQTVGVHLGGAVEQEVELPLWRNADSALSLDGVLGGNCLVRSVSGELWSTLYGKAGIVVALPGGIELKTGMKRPLYTSNRLYNHDIDGVVITRPQGRWSPYLETSMPLGQHWRLGIYLDTQLWAQSARVPYRYRGDIPWSDLALAGALYQPDTRVIDSGMMLERRF